MKTIEFFSQPSNPAQGSMWLQSLLAAQGTRRDPPWTEHPSITGPFTPTLTLRLVQFRYSCSPHVHISDVGINWGAWRKPRLGGTCWPQIVMAPAGNQLSFSHSCYNETTLNKRTYLRTCCIFKSYDFD